MSANRSNPGIVYLVGAGPGDPGLITVRGLDLLRRAEVLVYDYLANPQLLDEAPADCQRIYVGKKAGSHTLTQEEINGLLVEKCGEGRRVVRLKGGDPFVFGRGGEEALALRAVGFAFEVVPGITAGIAAPAYAGIPVTHRGLASTLSFVTGHEQPGKEDSDIDWEQLAKGCGTIVFYMGVGNLPRIAERLMAHGRAASTPVALVRWGTRPEQRTVSGTLTDIAEKVANAQLKPPALIVVGEVVALREQLDWFEKRPLFGRRIVVTRSRAQAGDLSRRLEALGAEAVEFPVIRIAPPEDAAPLRAAAAEAERYDWIVFTSVNGVEAFFNALRELGRDARALGQTRVCAIGPATAERCERYGVRPDLLPPKYVAESVAEALGEVGEMAGARVLVPRADIARSYLPEALERMGATVDVVTAYQTVLDEPENIEDVRADLLSGSIAAVTFSSSSTVRNFARLIGEDVLRGLPESVLLASIGPETTKTLAEYTDAPIEQAEEYTMGGVVDLIVKRLASL